MRPFPFSRLLVAGREERPDLQGYSAMPASCPVHAAVAFTGTRTTVPELHCPVVSD